MDGFQSRILEMQVGEVVYRSALLPDSNMARSMGKFYRRRYLIKKWMLKTCATARRLRLAPGVIQGFETA